MVNADTAAEKGKNVLNLREFFIFIAQRFDGRIENFCLQLLLAARLMTKAHLLEFLCNSRIKFPLADGAPLKAMSLAILDRPYNKRCI